MAVQRCIIGNNLAKILFALEPPLGKSIQLGRQKYEVVGVMEHRPAGDDEGGKRKSPNLTVYIPMQTGLHRLVALNEPDDLDEIAVQLQPESDLEELKQVMERILKRRHNNVVDYSFVIPELLLKQKQATQRIFSVVLLFIAGLSLLVGGIGIMNIMLATVTQRTKEIGIRRAIGATQNDILVQFLVEALLICLIGGVVGIGVGWGLSQAAQFYAGWSTIINIPAVIVAITVASATGLIFGLYPSLQAAKLDPIEALRHE
jgi:putative ABC transport system permease protein